MGLSLDEAVGTMCVACLEIISSNLFSSWACRKDFISAGLRKPNKKKTSGLFEGWPTGRYQYCNGKFFCWIHALTDSVVPFR